MRQKTNINKQGGQKMIDNYRNLKKIATIDGKYYISKDIMAITESIDNIELTTKKDIVIIPKTSISRIEYYKGAVADGKRSR